MVKRNKRVFLIIGFLLIVLIILSPLIYGLVIEMLTLPHRISWRDRTSPLKVEVIQDLCQKFNLSDQDPRCKTGTVVYAPEFFQPIRSDFIHSNGESVTYDYVQEKLGRYQYGCSSMITEHSTGVEYFSCSYDLQGDRVYPIGIFYYSTGHIWRFFADTAD
jgi:hypothetical protein